MVMFMALYLSEIHVLFYDENPACTLPNGVYSIAVHANTNAF